MFPAADLHRAYQTYVARRDGPTSAVLAEALICLIDQRLANAGEILPGRAAALLLDQLVEAGASLQPTGDAERLTIYGVVTSSTAGPLGLLRNWQVDARRTHPNAAGVAA